MAALSGVKGNVSIGTGVGQNALITRWTASADREVHDISNFDSALNERDKLGGMLHIQGTAEGVIDSAAMPLLTQMQTEDLVSTAYFRLISKRGLVLDSHWKFYGTASNITLDVPKGGVQRITMAFESTGAISAQDFTDA